MTLPLIALLIGGALARDRDKDTDDDGIPDHIEREGDTDPYNPDTDGDGVPDGVEDTNQDGKVDAGESDPRVPGLFPGRAPHIPEPMVFDMIRGMGAHQGELEVNNLLVASDGEVGWAPEVEWAFLHGHAVEFELPMAGRHLEALKFAYQGTLPLKSERTIHGVQTFFEGRLDAAAPHDWVGLYMLGHRFSRVVSSLVMVGGVAEIARDGELQGGFLANPSLFFDVREWQTWGLESNLAVHAGGAWEVKLYPQVHLQLSERVRVQLAGGAHGSAEQWSPAFGTRVILE